MPRRAYTLIEVLAVVAIAGLVAAAVTPSLVRAATGDPLSEAMRQVREIDRSARQQAVGVGGTWGVAEGRVVSGIAGWQPSDDELPTGCTVSLYRASDGTELEHLALDRSGSSGDVQVVITYAGRSRSFRVLGLSGSWIDEPAGGATAVVP